MRLTKRKRERETERPVTCAVNKKKEKKKKEKKGMMIRTKMREQTPKQGDRESGDDDDAKRF